MIIARFPDLSKPTTVTAHLYAQTYLRLCAEGDVVYKALTTRFTTAERRHSSANACFQRQTRHTYGDPAETYVSTVMFNANYSKVKECASLNMPEHQFVSSTV